MNKWKLEQGMVVNSDGIEIAAMTDESTEQEALYIRNAPEMAATIKEFVDGVNSGKLRPRSAVKKFESVLNKLC